MKAMTYRDWRERYLKRYREDHPYSLEPKKSILGLLYDKYLERIESGEKFDADLTL